MFGKFYKINFPPNFQACAASNNNIIFFQATFEQVLSKLASQTLNIPPEEYEKARKRKTQNQTIEFLQDKAQELDIPLYDIRRLKEALHQDNQLATRKHREWKPGAV